jgi:hypothetical protein
MLSTTQHQKEWASVVKLLAKLKAHAAAHPSQPMPRDLKQERQSSFETLARDRTPPVATWKHLLKKQVSVGVGLLTVANQVRPGLVA